MSTFYHGTISIFQDGILKKGLARTEGSPNYDHEVGKRYVWFSPDIEVAAHYAELRAKSLSTPIGETFEVIRLIPENDLKMLPPQFRPFMPRVRKFLVTKRDGCVDPSARPVVFQIDLPDSWKVTPSPSLPDEWRCARRIPPSMLTLIELGQDFKAHNGIHAAISALAPCFGINWARL